MRTRLLKKAFLIVGATLMMCGFVVQASAISVPFTQNTGFNTTLGTLLSDQSGGTVATNDIQWRTSTVAVPAGLPVGYSIVSPTDPVFNTITWGNSNNNGGPDDGTNNWGNSNYSGLRVLGFAGNSTVGTWTTISRIYHQNNPIPSTNATLASAIIRSTLTVGTADVNPIPITFNETLNSGTCAGPSGLGTCPDEWTFNATGFAPVLFTYDGITYNADFQFANFNGAVLVTANTPIWSLWTRESATSSVDVQMQLTQVPVPEPATLTLLGLGLLGLAGTRRKFKK